MDSGFGVQNRNVPCILSGPILWRKFVFISSGGIDRIVGGVRLTTSVFDSCPVWLLKEARGRLWDWICHIVKASLRARHMTVSLKEAIAHPLLKKASLAPKDLANFRPVSNLPFLGKVEEKVVAMQLKWFLDETSVCRSFSVWLLSWLCHGNYLGCLVR